jgi:hypothetical protein
LLAFGSKSADKLRRHALRVRSADNDKDGNVEQAAARRMVRDRINAKAFEISLGVARDKSPRAAAAPLVVSRR